MSNIITFNQRLYWLESRGKIDWRNISRIQWFRSWKSKWIRIRKDLWKGDQDKEVKEGLSVILEILSENIKKIIQVWN